MYGVDSKAKPGTAGPTCGPVGAGLLLGLVEGVDLGRPLAGLHVLVAHGAVSPVPSPPRVTCPGVTAATLTLPPARPRQERGKAGDQEAAEITWLVASSSQLQHKPDYLFGQQQL